MTKTQLREIAARLVADGLRRAAALSVEAQKDWQMSHLVGGPEGRQLRLVSLVKAQRAARMRQISWRLAAAHGIGTKSTGRGMQPRPAGSSANTAAITDKRRVAHAR